MKIPFNLLKTLFLGGLTHRARPRVEPDPLSLRKPPSPPDLLCARAAREEQRKQEAEERIRGKKLRERAAEISEATRKQLLKRRQAKLRRRGSRAHKGVDPGIMKMPNVSRLLLMKEDVALKSEDPHRFRMTPAYKDKLLLELGAFYVMEDRNRNADRIWGVPFVVDDSPTFADFHEVVIEKDPDACGVDLLAAGE